jgi:preprotein translocase subunit SecA
VSRTIESAQSRVEGFNFDMRKRVVEYDDVINKQRETIYAERDKVLHNEDLTETVQASSTRGRRARRDVPRRRRHGSWNLEGLSTRCQRWASRARAHADDLWEVGSPRGDRRAPSRRW